jgi:CheY-like chemotaxis protein
MGAQGAARMSSGTSELEPVNILLVDDREGNLRSLEAMLRRADYRLILANSGQEALGHVLREELALILLDVAMPIMNGFQTASMIRGREQSRHIPIVFVTASVYDLDHIFRDHPGPVDYIRKPLDLHEVRSKVAVFVQMYGLRRKVERQAEQLREAELLRQQLLQELPQAMRARDDFFVSAAHELKTSIAPLRLQAADLLREMRKDHPADRLPPRLEHALETIERESDRLEHLIDRLRDTSKIDRGRMTLDLDLRHYGPH